jgi:cyclophilin family peptidyl-prolyl cis-trans isomerase
MLQRLLSALAVAALLASVASAQVVRFQTTVGDFDMVLNPTHNALLQEHVDNMLKYVNEDRYRSSWINRAASNFVLQMGGFYTSTKRPPLTVESLSPFFTGDPVQGVPAGSEALLGSGLSNTVGTVSLALSGNPDGRTTNQNSGSSSFFINAADNSRLDADFTVFAMIPDMTTVNKIMALTQVDRTTDPSFGAQSGNLAFSNIPLQDDGKQVFIRRAFVVSDAMTLTMDNAGINSALAQSAAAFAAGVDTTPLSAALEAGGGVASSPLPVASVAVPEPGSLLLMLIGALSVLGLNRAKQHRR